MTAQPEPPTDASASRDEPRALRDEEAFDVASLHAWLSDRVDGLGDPLGRLEGRGPGGL